MSTDTTETFDDLEFDELDLEDLDERGGDRDDGADDDDRSSGADPSGRSRTEPGTADGLDDFSDGIVDDETTQAGRDDSNFDADDIEQDRRDGGGASDDLVEKIEAALLEAQSEDQRDADYDEGAKEGRGGSDTRG